MRFDCFYTNRAIAAKCFDFVQESCGKDFTLWVEPSAGEGAFLDMMPEPKIGIDIQESKHPEIKTANFLEWEPPVNTGKIITMGNPPFGKNSSLAVRFFNHAARFSDTIAMIFPRTFQKASIINRLHKNFHMIAEMGIPPESFTLSGNPYSVPCAFQVWGKKASLRPCLDSPMTHTDFHFTTMDMADFALQRVGVNAGAVKMNMRILSPNSHYFIRECVSGVKDILQSIDWGEVKYKTAGNPSLAKPEVVSLYSRYKRELYHSTQRVFT